MGDEKKKETLGGELTRILLEHCAHTGLTPREVVEGLRQEGKRLREWGALPQEYDPDLDPSHPSRGWRPERTD